MYGTVPDGDLVKDYYHSSVIWRCSCLAQCVKRQVFGSGIVKFEPIRATYVLYTELVEDTAIRLSSGADHSFGEVESYWRRTSLNWYTIHENWKGQLHTGV